MASSIGNVQIKVDPAMMLSQAGTVRTLGNDMKRHFEAIATTMEKTKYYWLGEAGEAHRKLYNEQKDNVRQMIGRLLEHPDDLTVISGNMKSAEKAGMSIAKALPADVIG